MSLPTLGMFLYFFRPAIWAFAHTVSKNLVRSSNCWQNSWNDLIWRPLHCLLSVLLARLPSLLTRWRIQLRNWSSTYLLPGTRSIYNDYILLRGRTVSFSFRWTRAPKSQTGLGQWLFLIWATCLFRYLAKNVLGFHLFWKKSGSFWLCFWCRLFFRASQLFRLAPPCSWRPEGHRLRPAAPIFQSPWHC